MAAQHALLQGGDACLGQRIVLCAGAAAHADGPDDLAAHHQGIAAARGDHVVERRQILEVRALADQVLERERRAAIARRRARLVNMVVDRDAERFGGLSDLAGQLGVAQRVLRRQLVSVGRRCHLERVHDAAQHGVVVHSSGELDEPLRAVLAMEGIEGGLFRAMVRMS
jgi:hypothetical protein